MENICEAGFAVAFKGLEILPVILRRRIFYKRWQHHRRDFAGRAV